MAFPEGPLEALSCSRPAQPLNTLPRACVLQPLWLLQASVGHDWPGSEGAQWPIATWVKTQCLEALGSATWGV